MNTTELLEYHSKLCHEAREIMAKKNHDYSGSSGETPFANFMVAEQLSITMAEKGIILRITDKLMRIITFLNSGELKVSESVEDACTDILNYVILLAALMKEKQDKQKTTNDNSNYTNLARENNLSGDIHTPGFSPP